MAFATSSAINEIAASSQNNDNLTIIYNLTDGKYRSIYNAECRLLKLDQNNNPEILLSRSFSDRDGICKFYNWQRKYAYELEVYYQNGYYSGHFVYPSPSLNNDIFRDAIIINESTKIRNIN